MAIMVGTGDGVWLVDDAGGDRIDELPSRLTWYFPRPPHEPHVRSIDFLPAAVRCAVGDGSPSSIMGWR